MDASADPRPLAQGKLLETPLCHLALYVYRRTQSGTLFLEHPEGQRAILRVQRGRIVAARLPWPAGRLLTGLLPLCGLRDGAFSFFAEDLLAEGDGVVSGIVDPYELLMASLQDHARDDMVDAVLRRFAGKPLRIAPGADLDRLRLPAAHKPLIELIRAAPATSDELIAQTPLPATTARRLLYALLASNAIAPHGAGEAEAPRSQAPARTSQPATPFASDPPRSADVPAAWQRLASLRPLGSLGPPSVAPGRARAQPPSALPGPVSLRPASLTPASLAPAADDDAARQRRAEQLLQHGRPDEALAEVDALLQLAPRRADLLALRAHALFDKHQGSIDGLPRAVLDAIKKALEADPDHPRALYVKGLTYKRAGEPKKALVYFKRTLLSDPKHIEAAREVRLAKLRESKH